MSYTHVRFAGVKDKLFISLIDGIVSKMYEIILQVLLFSLLIIFGCKTCQSLFIDVDPNRITAIY
jgi:hypothetical protein